ncbi:phosphohexomutase domain-containing protein [Mangrovicoccus algicola]|uniref:Phosphomannomutase n=1 Tax=Mangrovicoccus algicola TaxID=2771008 RepID=A0A8J6YUH2_9RHOB|nr:phosphomannomutase [Mangrovicoccus algicola]MBE3639498.1 phosphomannomutase [Mangrovicoccus algicola]
MSELTCFKSYDIRGRLGENLDAAIAYRIGRAFAQVMAPGLTVCGRDIRESSAELQAALIEGLLDGGSDVIDIGLCGTEEVYFATDHFGAGGGLEVTASHNPIDYNGIKMVREGSRPISGDNGLLDIKAVAETGDWAPAARGTLRQETPRTAYAARILSFVDPAKFRPLKILVNAGHGVAGPAFDAVEAGLRAAGVPLEFVRIHHDPDGSFPQGIPNPLLPENQPQTADQVRAHGADMGVAWDGDFDRCFLFDETGAFIDGEYIVGLLAAAFLPKEPGARIVHDPRVMWNTLDVVAKGGGEAVVSRTGHALIKARMREVDAVYGGEMSAHHYFRNFMYCDSGMIPWLLVAEHMGTTGQSLSALVAQMRADFPSSGEINFTLADAKAAMDRVEAELAPGAIGGVDRLDGISMAFEDWRVNLRRSNTEPVLRLNVETRGDRDLLGRKVEMLRAIITA